MVAVRPELGTLPRPGVVRALTIDVATATYTVLADDGPVIVGRRFPAQVRIDDDRVSRTHLLVEAGEHGWTGTDQSRNGVFVGGQPRPRFAITDGLTVRLGHPDGVPVTFGFTDDPDFEDEAEDAESRSWTDGDDVDPVLLRVGEAVAARRRELDLAQRTLARDKVINAGTLIDFEKGRRWPRERTRARLEHALGWPAGAIARLRSGVAPSSGDDVERTEVLGSSTTVSAEYMAQAVELALDTIKQTVGELPAPSAPDFSARAAAALRDLRRLEVMATNASRSAAGASQVVMTLSGIRQTYRELMLRAARSPNATLGQALYAARQRAELTVEEAAGAAGVTPAAVVAAEGDDPLTKDDRRAVEDLLRALTGH